MNDEIFERQLFAACDGFWGKDDWTDKRGRNYEWVMDELALYCTDEQWQIVEDTINSLRDPDYITGTASLDTPVTHNYDWK